MCRWRPGRNSGSAVAKESKELFADEVVIVGVGGILWDEGGGDGATAGGGRSRRAFARWRGADGEGVAVGDGADDPAGGVFRANDWERVQVAASDGARVLAIGAPLANKALGGQERDGGSTGSGGHGHQLGDERLFLRVRGARGSGGWWSGGGVSRVSLAADSLMASLNTQFRERL